MLGIKTSNLLAWHNLFDIRLKLFLKQYKKEKERKKLDCTISYM